MKKVPYKARLWIGVGLIIWSILALVATIVYASHGAPIWILTVGPILAFVAFIIGIIFVPKRKDESEPQKTVSSKIKVNRPKKIHKKKEPFITEEELEELDDEDEEAMYIDGGD